MEQAGFGRREIDCHAFLRWLVNIPH